MYSRYSHIVFALLAASAAVAQSAPSVPPVDAPELSHWGQYEIGVRTIQLVHKDQPNVLAFDKETGEIPTYDRPLPVEVWYPTRTVNGEPPHTEYETPLPRGNVNYTTLGRAERDAEPLSATKPFPLILISHGYPGTRILLSYLGENLASKGYVVAAIDHTDSVFGAVGPFQSTLVNRTKDQLFVISQMSKVGLPVDSGRVGILGYSMGGYGAITTAGAGYSSAGTASRMVPGELMQPLTAGDPAYAAVDRSAIKAVVAIAPWGMQAPHRNWDEAGLAGLRVPSLFIVGDHDDISGYEDGVRKLFEGAVNSERWMLVFQNARHNVGGNPPPAEALSDFKTRESFDEPVWRKDRITAINQHFVTAFLDLHVKGDETRRAYLDLPTVESKDGLWPLPAGQSAGDSYSDGEAYWKGFRRRWALGLELHHEKAAQ